MSNKSSGDVISLPKGGGALSGIGEKFSPDLHTGTGNFTIPIAVPPGRNGFQPQLNLVYSTGNGNGPFGLGWSPGIPCVSRKTSKGIPRNDEVKDVFILSGEDLVAVEKTGTATRYRPRTEGLFAEIFYHRDPANSYWEVHSKDGLKSRYGSAAALGTDPAVIAQPADRTRVFAWNLTHTEDPFGNRIEYDYERDAGEEGPHHWDQLYLSKIRYVDFGNNPVNPSYLVAVEFKYGLRPDPHSGYRSGFEIRTRKRCTSIQIHINAGHDQLVRTYELLYLDQRPALAALLPLNGVSLLSQVSVTGHDEQRVEKMPPLEFRYTGFEPRKRDFFPLRGPDLPARSLANPGIELVDLFGNGLPDFVEIDGTVRYWRNLGNGRFDRPRFMNDAPAGLLLADAGVQFIDANGDGRTDLLVTNTTMAGYFPLSFNGQWDRRSFQRYRQAPSFDLKDPEVKLVDLDGDGVTDAIRSGSRLECFFNDPLAGWNSTRQAERQALSIFPNVNFSDPRVKWADLTGSGLQSIALVYDGCVEYWPSLGRGRWGKRIHMLHGPRFPAGYDPRRILLGDVDGDGLADIIYVENTSVTLWINQSGNRWSDPIKINGTPPVSDMDAVRLVDLLGSGISGILWSRDNNSLSRDHFFFLDFTGGLKPYLLHEVDNHIGALTKVDYAPSVRFYLEDQKRPQTRWKTTLPFPVQVVAGVEVIDHFSKGKHTTAYRYHHGYWDGAEREFRGFGMVEQLDTESFEKYGSAGLHGAAVEFTPVEQKYFSPPILGKTWFHQGPVGDEFGDWQEPDRSDEYWPDDPQLLRHTESVNAFLKTWKPTPEGRRIKRDALRALRGNILRTEVYALDGSDMAERPYTVSESGYGLAEIEAPGTGDTKRFHIFCPHPVSQRTTQWERGHDPVTCFSFTRYTDDADKFDPFGRPLAQTQVACPRGWRNIDDQPAGAYLATRTSTVYAKPVGQQVYIHTRIARSTSYEITNTEGKRVPDFVSVKDSDTDLKLFGQTLNFYDGAAFTGLPLGQAGSFGALTRSKALVLNDDILQDAYDTEIPPYLEPAGNPASIAGYPLEFSTLLPQGAGYIFHAGSADPADPKGYFVNAGRTRYDFQSNPSGKGRGLVLESLDPLHDETADPAAHRIQIKYDEFQFLPEQVIDAAGLTVQAENDYRVFQPGEVTDPNGNRSSFTFSPLGLLESSSVRGKNAAEGDQSRPGVRMEYGFLAFENSPPGNRLPIFVRSIRHVHHDTELDVALPGRDETIITIEYSDGFGRLLQTRIQGEELRFGDEHFGGGEAVLPIHQSNGAGNDLTGRRNADETSPNVVVSGWQTYDNKSQVVEKYEPFFSEGWDYGQPGESKTGQMITMFYDPRGQVIRTVNPDGSEQRVIYGVPGTIAAPNMEDPETFEPTPWEAYTYDANDNAGRTHPAASAVYQHHWNTPASILIDALGRTTKAVARNRDPAAVPGGPASPMQELITRTTCDIRGNALQINDALDRPAFRHVYDFANRNLRIDSIDAGRRTTVLDASGGIVEQRDSKAAFVLHSYDGLNRPIRLWARDGEGQELTLRERMEYGDAGSAGQSAAGRQANKAANRLGKLFRHFDEAGMLQFDAYDFKGNLREKTRRVVSDAAILQVFNHPAPSFRIEAFRVNWTNPAAVPLDATAFISTVQYDAISRVKLMTYPADVENKRRRLRPQYNRSGALELVALEQVTAGGGITSDTFVERIAYNAKGQRVLIAYGNGLMTRYAYDPQTFRLLRLRTEHYNKPADLLYQHTGSPQQELAYTFDLAGNILQIQERTPGCGIPNTPLGRDALDRTFAYDALCRLLSTTGRECDRPPDLPWDETFRCTDLTKTRPYTEQYLYDLVGNIKQLQHASGTAGSFTRDFGLAAGNNQLHTLTTGTAVFDYEYDANGNMIRETTSRHFDWDHTDRMRVYRTQTDGSEASVYAQYLYDAGGQRVKKLVRKQGGQVEVTVYIDGIFEYQRIVRGQIVEQNNTLHVMDNQSRIALVRIGNPFGNDATPAVKYHLGDHLGSSSLVIDGTGAIINREEYTPYGETSFGSFARKRYRFTGKERDEESGLNYHRARYYSAWLGRWTSCDPIGYNGGLNLFRYGDSNPLNFVDVSGMDPEAATNNSESESANGSGGHWGVGEPAGTLNPGTGLPNSTTELVMTQEPVSSTKPDQPKWGVVEGKDVMHFGKGVLDSIGRGLLYNMPIYGPIINTFLPQSKPDPNYGGAELIGRAVGIGLLMGAEASAPNLGGLGKVPKAVETSSEVAGEVKAAAPVQRPITSTSPQITSISTKPQITSVSRRSSVVASNSNTGGGTGTGIPAPNSAVPMPLGRGSTGRTIPNTINEQIAMAEAMADPEAGIPIPVKMNDQRWLSADGWVKMRQNINNIEIHYVRNTVTGAIDDFKFK